jgi:protein SCO1/2
MTFIYTHCPDVCPAATYQLTKLQEALGDNYGTSVEILSITVDPERDTVERLANWSTERNASWPHLTSEA